jgi:putative ABC transport system permease protein
MMTTFRQAAMLLVRRPAFALTCIATLAIGVGITVGLFSVIDAILIRQLPYPSADRLATIFEVDTVHEQARSNVAPARLEDWKRKNLTFEAISGSYAETATDLSGDEPERLDARRVMPEFFAVFGVRPVLGRTFDPAEEMFGGPGAAVISEGLWTRRYGRQATVIDRPLVIGGRDFAIVGVMPSFFSGPVDVWLPMQSPPALGRAREARFLGGIGRLKHGVTVEQAQSDLGRVQRELAREFPRTDEGWTVLLGDLKEARVGEYRRPLVLVFGAVCLLLFIGVANISGLMLAQLHRRRREFALRVAIGATRQRLAAGVIWETAILTVCAAGFGAIIALGFVAICQKAFADVPRIDEVRVDVRALAVAVLATVAATIACGVLPALRMSVRTTPLSLLDRRGASARHRLHTTLITGQIALGLLLLTTAGVLLRSYTNLTRVDLGFDADNVVTFRAGSAWNEDRAHMAATQELIVSRLQQRSDVQAAGITNFLPTTSATWRFQVIVDGIVGPEADGGITVGYRVVSAGYLRALNVPLVSGSWCPDLRADPKSVRTALVNRAFGDTLAPGDDLVGRNLTMARARNSPMRIVGVIGNLVEDGQGAALVPYVYSCEPAGTWPDPVYVARTHAPEALLGEIRPLVRGVDASRAVFAVGTLSDFLDSALDRPRLLAQMLGLFATAALALAVLGVYGLFALAVSERTQEVGIRMALGATRRNVGWMVFKHAAGVLLSGTLIGLALTVATNRALSGVLFGVPTLDLRTILIAIVVLTACAMTAVTVPALRAVRTDPVNAIRLE